jgi:lipid-A-disaccharide synthase-like uncharacterized protein
VILPLAVLAGLLCGLARAWITNRKLLAVSLHRNWLAAAAFLPQWLAFYLPATRSDIPTWLASASLIGSQILLLVFVWFNRTKPALWLLGAGLVLNLLVIVANGGFMPVSPMIVAHLNPQISPDVLQVGDRFVWSRNILLPAAETRLWWLSDRLLLPPDFPFSHAAYSIGDLLIASGAFLLLWGLGDRTAIEDCSAVMEGNT